MPKSDKPKSKDSKSANSDTVRRIWLAGIGAYGRAFAEAKGALDEVSGKGSAVFDDLVQKGEVLEAVGKAKGKAMFDKANVVPDLDIDDRIMKMRERLKGGRSERDLVARVAMLEARLDALEGKSAPSKPAPSKPVKSKPKKTRASKAAKASSAKTMTTEKTKPASKKD